MRTLFVFLTMGLIAGFIFFASCNGDNGDEDLTPQQEQAKLLQGTWTVQSATVPQGVQPDILNGGTLTFNTDQDYNPSSFSSAGMPDFFSASGSSAWSFSGQSTNQVVLTGVSPVSEFTINNLSGNSLSISFSHPGMAGGRVKDLSGAYTASLTK
jgi:hypothetical protein